MTLPEYVPSEHHSAQSALPEHHVRNDILPVPAFDLSNTTELDFDWSNVDLSLLEHASLHTNPGHDIRRPDILAWSPGQPNDRALWTDLSVFATNPTLQSTPKHDSRQIIRRPNVHNSTQRVAKLIWHVLKSYLIMHSDMLPPFLHSSLLAQDKDDLDMEPIHNGLTLMQLFRAGDKASRRLFWKNVRLECERFRDEYLDLNRWQLLASMQALSIYLLARLQDGESEYNNFDSLLVNAVTVIAKQLTRVEVAISTKVYTSSNDAWKDWIFEESRRRICVIYQIVNMLAYFEPAAMCDLPPGLLLAPLPANKRLWEASDPSNWEAEQHRTGALTDFGLTTKGDLVRLPAGQVWHCDTASVLNGSYDVLDLASTHANWEEWCSSMDSFGSLIMLAASLVG